MPQSNLPMDTFAIDVLLLVVVLESSTLSLQRLIPGIYHYICFKSVYIAVLEELLAEHFLILLHRVVLSIIQTLYESEFLSCS